MTAGFALEDASSVYFPGTATVYSCDFAEDSPAITS